MTMARTPSGFMDYSDGIYTTDGQRDLLAEILEYVPELRWPQAGDVLNRMRKDSQLSAGLGAYVRPIQAAAWALDGSGCRDEVTAQLADDLGLPILGTDPEPTGARRRKFTFAEHLRMALLDLPFGHMPFEQTYDTSDGKTARLLRVDERMPKSIDGIYVDGDGQIDYVTQPRVFGMAEPPKIAPPALVWYVNEREGVQWRGTSLLRSAYPYWLIKDQMLRTHAESIRRYGMGIPTVNAPQGASPQQIAEAARYAAQMQSNPREGGGLPAGFTKSLTGLVGSVPDALAFIKYLDQAMAVELHTQFLNLGTTESGSRSVGEVHEDLLQLSRQAVANQHAEQATDQIVVPLVDANWGENEPAPRIVCGHVGAEQVLSPADLALLVTSGALQADATLDATIRQQYKFPARTTPWVDPHQVPDPLTALPPEAIDA